MPKPKIRISLYAFMMEKLAKKNKLTFMVGDQEYEISLSDFRMELRWRDYEGKQVPDVSLYSKKPSEMN